MLDILIFIFRFVFSIFFYLLLMNFFYCFTQWLLDCLIRCVHKFFNLYLGVFFSVKTKRSRILYIQFFLLSFDV
jgi:hypothetical protein